MAQNKRQARLLGLVDESDIDEISSDSLVSFAPEGHSNAPDVTAAKRGRGRPAANKVNKSTVRTTRRVGAKGSAATVREALSAKSTNKDAPKPKKGRNPKQKDDAEMADDREDLADATNTKSTGVRRRGRPAKTTKADASTISAVPDVPPQGLRATSRAPLLDISEIPETQHPAAIDVDSGEYEAIVESSPIRNPSGAAPATRFSWCSPLKHASDIADSKTSTAQLRRRIGDLSKKCEGLETKYRDLREIGVNEAERNFDRLKKQTDERTMAANTLIQQLRDDLSDQRALAEEGRQHQQHLEATRSEVSALGTSLAEARKEISTLAAKLAVSRSAEAATAGVKIPGSAVKGHNATKAAAGGNLEAVQTAQMKEDLYGDLTGLIVRGIKREVDGDVYDCIQTGRNGTLHFKLVVENETSSDSYEEAQFTYISQLDDNRDRDLIELLPDYLIDEITFPRPHAAKFFSRVTRSLME